MEHSPVTQIVRLTPEGRGAVAVLLVAGPRAAEQVGRHFFGHVDVPLENRPLNRIYHGHWGGPDGEDVVVCRRSDSEVEIHCHGGRAAAERIVADLSSSGCQVLAWRDWLSRHESNGIRTEATRLLADACTERTAAILLDQYHGALDAALADIESNLEAGNGEAATIGLDTLLSRSRVGLHLVDPWRVVLAGPPNVGKSSLINALIGYRRSIVFDQPGTTRDVVTVATALDGWPIALSDTAGLRTTDDPLEHAGVDLARRTLAAADCVVLVFDATERAADRGNSVIRDYPEAIVAYNKADLLAPSEVAGFQAADIERPSVLTSAVTGHGIGDLAAAIVRRLIGVEPRPRDAIPFTPSQVEQLRSARDAVGRGQLAMARALIHDLRRSGFPA
jgi:tRNA modification GTPase